MISRNYQAKKKQSLQETCFGVTTTKPPPLEGIKFVERKRTICLRRVKIEKVSPRRKEEKHSHVSCETSRERKLHKCSHMNCKSNPYAQGAECWYPANSIQKPMRKIAQWKAKPKDPPKRPKSKKGTKKEVQGKAIYSKMQIYSRLQIYSRIQICHIIQFFSRMALTYKGKWA